MSEFAPRGSLPVRVSGERMLQERWDTRERADQFYRLQVLDHLNARMREFIGAQEWMFLATSDASGACDSTLRAGPPGFVAVLDEHRLAWPEYRGNGVMASRGNVAENPHVGLLFMVPGIDETLRVNGTARITTDARLLTPLAVQGKVPAAGLLVGVEEVFFHCGKALIRSRLWDVKRQVERRSFPTLGRILADQIAGADPRLCEQAIVESYRDRLY